jgi:ParB-like chromosome segregation protein Spo0J
MKATQLEIRHLPIADLQPAPYNPRRVLKPGSPAYRKLAASLREFGLVEPLIWNEATGHVVGGHARLRILKDMGLRTVAVSVVHLTSEREKALNIVLNNREAQSRYDSAMLADLLEELQGLPELELSGFEESDLAALRLEPLAESPATKETGRVEVTLLADAATFERCSERLDALIGEFDLTCHINRR